MRHLNIGGRLLKLDIPRIMGIININDDSFYSGSRQADVDSVLKKAEQMIREGVDIIDLGAFSSSPRARLISFEEERSRLEPVVEAVFREFPGIFFSIDTYRSDIVRRMSEYGPFIINDISGFEYDNELPATVADKNLPYILMHMRGTPENMITKSQYDDVSLEVLGYLNNKLKTLERAGVRQVIIDPGFGFAKNIRQNYEMLRKLNVFKIAELPVLIGISRKSMIYKTLGVQPEECLNGTTAAHMAALINGADILRVHDVREAKETVKIFLALTRVVND